MGETAVAMPRPAELSVGVTASRELPRVASAPPPPPSNPKVESIEVTAQKAVAAANKEIEDAKARSKGDTGTLEAKASIKTAPPSPPASEVAPQLPPGVTQADIARLKQNITDKVMTEQEAAAEFEKLVNKAVGIPDETHSTPPISKKKTVHKEATLPSPKTSSTSTSPPIEHKTENSFLSKTKNIVEKIFSIPAAIWRYLTGWIMK